MMPPSPNNRIRPVAALSLLAVILVIGMGVYIGTRTGEDTTSTGQRLQVNLGIFSGRPDPTWTTTTAELDGLTLEAIRRLPPVDTFPATGLGYHGFFIIFLDADGNQTAWLQVYDGVIALSTTETEVQYYRDELGLETLLLSQARTHGYGDLIDGE